ncbi:MAG: putative quinol monooxygenase [Gammaproteobacteria bacterium]
MVLTIFAGFHAREGFADALAKVVRDVVPPSRAEAGCLSIEAYRSIQDSAWLFIHSRWVDEVAFERHAGLAHTIEFLAAVASLVDQLPQIARTKPLDHV